MSVKLVCVFLPALVAMASGVALQQQPAEPYRMAYRPAAAEPNYQNKFAQLWQQYQGGFNKYFFDYCNHFVQEHPTSPYIGHAKEYINTYYSYAYQPSNLVTKHVPSGYAPPATGEVDFYDLYHKYGTEFNQDFLNYCTNYLRKHPQGAYLPYAKNYVERFSSHGYDYKAAAVVTKPTKALVKPVVEAVADQLNHADGFYKMYSQFHSTYNTKFYDFCVKYVEDNPKGFYTKYAKRYIHKYENHGPGGNDLNADFMKMFKKYGKSYSKDFYDYCKGYIANNPKGSCVELAHAYVKKYFLPVLSNLVKKILDGDEEEENGDEEDENDEEEEEEEDENGDVLDTTPAPTPAPVTTETPDTHHKVKIGKGAGLKVNALQLSWGGGYRK